jgi:hypothetical protein
VSPISDTLDLNPIQHDDALQFLDRYKSILEGIDLHRLVVWLKQYKKQERGDLL